MRIGPVILHNVGPFKHVEFDLSKPGLTGVEGVMHDRPGCTSNGSGKSMLVEGVSWIIFDRFMRDRYGKDDLIRLQFRANGGGEFELLIDSRGRPLRPEGGSYGIVNIVDASVPIRIERYRRHPTEGNRAKLFLDGKEVTRGRDAMTNEAIVDALGMDFRTFTSSVAFGVREDVKSFFSATDSERKAILDKLLGMELYASAQVRARTRLREVAETLEVSERKRETLRGRIEEQETALADLEDAGSDLPDEPEFCWRRARMRGALARLQRDRVMATVSEAQDAVTAEEEAAQGAQEAHREALEAYRLERRSLEGKRRTKAEARGERVADGRQAQTTIDRWAKLKGRCPTCEQIVSQALVVRSQREALAARDASRDDVATLRKEEARLGALLQGLREPVPPDLPELAEARRTAQEWREELRVWETRVAGLETATSAARREFERAEGRRETVEERLAELTASLREAEEEDAGKQVEADRLEFWVEGFGPGGLRSFLIENEIPEINRVATSFAQRLLGNGAVVRIAATRELKGGGEREELSIEAIIPGCCDTYAKASTGLRKRLDLALLLAFREIVGRRFSKSFDQLFADELFDGLDEAGEDSVVELLKEISATCPVLLVTHSDALKAAADRLLVVHHENGVATLEEV